MKEFIISEAQTERAVLVGLVTPEQNEQKVKEYLDELAFLADTAGVEAVKRFTQKAERANSVTFVGTGKLQEIKLTRALERKYSKNEILELYLNTIYFGHACYGIAGAADYYFGKGTEELNAAESAMLAAIIRSPNRYSPFADPEKCLRVEIPFDTFWILDIHDPLAILLHDLAHFE